jgi:Tfp pilus assembly protein PilF
MLRLLISTMLSIILSGCATSAGRCLQELFQPSSMGQEALAAGLALYDEGDYADSLKNLKHAIAQGLTRQESANAHKHLAFINCVSERETQCRREFRNALALDPAMELAPAESGHPIWGPIFRSLKAPGSRPEEGTERTSHRPGAS